MGGVGGVEEALFVDWEQMGEGSLVWRGRMFEIVEGPVGMGQDDTLSIGGSG